MEKTKGQLNGETKVPYVDGDAYSAITKREYFAGLAMQGLMASMIEMRANGQSINMHGGMCENLAIECVDMADALLEELAKSK
jgi:hypothetical protein